MLQAKPASAATVRRPRTSRAFDLVLSAVAVAFLAPLLLLLALAVKLEDGGPALYAQERIGLRGRRFRCLKFRSMATDSAERLAILLATDPDAAAEWAQNHKLKIDPRVTRIGAFLRKSSLDELPQLFNVLRGEMSLVGPRPIVEAEVPRYGPNFADYCSVRPGITGLWQISGRSDMAYASRVALDVQYARRKCLGLDLAIILKTIPAVLMQRGSY